MLLITKELIKIRLSWGQPYGMSLEGLSRSAEVKVNKGGKLFPTDITIVDNGYGAKKRGYIDPPNLSCVAQVPTPRYWVYKGKKILRTLPSLKKAKEYVITHLTEN